MRLIHGDALEVARSLPDNSINLIVTDPPYYRVKGEWWDRQWDTADGFLAWLGEHLAEWQRVLKPNGSLYVFASPRMAARVEVEVGKRFEVLNRIRWIKEDGWHNKAQPEALRSFLSPWEKSSSRALRRGQHRQGEAKLYQLRKATSCAVRVQCCGRIWRASGRAGLAAQTANIATGSFMATYLTRRNGAPRDKYEQLRSTPAPTAASTCGAVQLRRSTSCSASTRSCGGTDAASTRSCGDHSP